MPHYFIPFYMMKSLTDNELEFAVIPNDSQTLWWNMGVRSAGQTNVNNPYGDRDLIFQGKNLPDVYSCLCGSHPLPSQPVVQRMVAAYDGFDRPVKYLVSGIPRSASTVIWQIARMLGDEAVIKSHGFNDSCPLFNKYEKVICTVRHPFDAYFSSLRALGESLEWMDQSMEEMKKFLKFQKFQECMDYRSDLQLYFIKYEDFWNDDLKRIKHLASLLEVECSYAKALEILSETSLEHNAERTQGNKESVAYKNSGILKGHIGNLQGKPGQGAQLAQDVKKRIIENYSWFFEHFNYSMEI